MDNSNCEWRVGAKVVAILDLIGSIVYIVLIVALIFVAGLDTTLALTSDEKLPAGASALAWVAWMVIAVLFTLTFVGLWAVIQLINATEWGRGAKEAQKFCQSWQLVCISSIVLNFIASIVMASYIMLANLLIRGVFYFVVHQFVQELKAIVIGMPRQMPQFQKV